MDKIPEKYEDLPPTPAEQMEVTNRLVTAENDKRTRLRRARDNRAKGHEAPRPGTRMFISLDRAIEARRRAGHRFERGQRATILIVDATDEEIAKAQERGVFPEGVDGVVNVDGAERILEDDALMVHQSAHGLEDIDALRREKDALAAELARAREENATLRQARMAAPPSKQGEPSRLIAAREAAAVKVADKPAEKIGAEPSGEFGGEPSKPKP